MRVLIAWITGLVLAGLVLNVRAATTANTPEGLSAADWADITRQIEAPKYRVHEAPVGYQAHNPAQGFHIRYQADGQTRIVARDAGAKKPFQIGLKLEALGYGEHLRVLSSSESIIADNHHTVTYQWDTGLREWWVNSPAGVEQGFELRSRPQGHEGRPLTLVMKLDSDLKPTIDPGAKGLTLQSDDGATRIRYDQLKVHDADRKSVAARMALKGSRLLLEIDDRNARYPLTIDPAFAQQAYLKASNTDAGDQFGFSVAISGDTVVVGAPGEASSATGIDGDQTDKSAISSGAAYVFVCSGATWSQQAYLKTSNTGAGDWFGFEVAISGDSVVVGAVNEDSRAMGVDGNGADNSAIDAGAAYVFAIPTFGIGTPSAARSRDLRARAWCCKTTAPTIFRFRPMAPLRHRVDRRLGL